MNDNHLHQITPLTSEQYAAFSALLNSLDSQQTSWIAGYFAALAGKPSAQISVLESKNTLTILYGSMTGKGEEIATLAASKALQIGLEYELRDMAEFTTQDLTRLQNVLVVVSTHGKGAPPFPAKGLHDYLFSNRAPKLNGLNYAVLALGDSSYDHFCQVGIEFDQQLEKLGANRLMPLHLGDVDVNTSSQPWLDKVLPLYASGKALASGPGYSFLKKSMSKKAPGSLLKKTTFVTPAKKTTLPGKSNPFSAPILEKKLLHGADAERQTIHLEIKADAPGMSYQPGDSAGVIPLNHPDLIQNILNVTGFDGNLKLTFKEKKRSLEKILSDSVELSRVTLDVVKKYVSVCPLETLHKLAGERDKLSDYIKGRDLVDLLTDFPTEGLTPEAFLSILRPLQPRYYSISSSPLESPGVIHLTVGKVMYEWAGRTRKGTCSSYLTDIKMENEHIPVFIESNTHFRLPEDPSKPIIMLGAGTGVAPFRAFVQHRSHTGNSGKSWLFFGNRHRETEFLYESEWEQQLKSGVLTRMDVAFSRDGNEKKYVQHCLLERADEVYQWLEEGAYLYLCGDMNGFSTDTQKALVQIIGEQGQRSPEEAEAYLDALQYAGRFQMDVY